VRIEASAPGKLILLGEYAVLEGAPALVMAVDRRARVSVTGAATDSADTRAPSCSVSVTAMAPEPYTANGHVAAGQVHWEHPDDATQRMSLVSALLNARLGSATPPPAESSPPLRATIETIDFFQENGVRRKSKLGLGSSAAVTVALAAALDALSGAPLPASETDALAGLLDLHRRFQSGRGSGADLAASLLGGVVEYELAPATKGGNPMPQVARLGLPPELQWAAVWTGRSASTGAFLEALDRWRAQHAAEYGARMDALGQLAREGVAAARLQSATRLLDCAARFGAELGAFGAATGLDIVSAEHAALLGYASRCGVVYKPCGAGGGDLGVAMASDAQALDRFTGLAREQGFMPLPLGLDTDGLQLKTRLE
jgi:phosphomevalonate kinase